MSGHQKAPSSPGDELVGALMALGLGAALFVATEAMKLDRFRRRIGLIH